MPLAVSALVDWLPEIPTAPTHAPEAEQIVAFVEDQVSVDELPLATKVGFAAIDTVTTLLAWPPVLDAPAASVTASPVQAGNVRASTRTSSKVLVRNIGPHYLTRIATLIRRPLRPKLVGPLLMLVPDESIKFMVPDRRSGSAR